MRNLYGYVVVMTFLTLMVSGCGTTKPTHFYLLQAADTAIHQDRLAKDSFPFSLGVGPLSLPKYLDRPQIVMRASMHELSLAEFHKWAEPLKNRVLHVLAENLSDSLLIDEVVVFPWKRSQAPDYQVTFDVVQFDGMEDREVVLKVRWKLLGGEGTRVLQQKVSIVTEPWDGQDYRTLVETMSRMLSIFSQEISASVLSLVPAK